MARIRSVKPAFWEDRRLAGDLTRDQRLFYIGLWNQADDEGRFLAHPRRLLGAIFPYDEDLPASFVADALQKLADTERLVLYEVDGEPYGQLTKFKRHQRISRPTPSAIPPLPLPERSRRRNGKLHEDSRRTHGGLTEDSVPRVAREEVEGSKEMEEEGKGKETTTAAVAAHAPNFGDFWAAYPKRSGSNPRNRAEKAWLARLKEKTDPAEITAGLERYRSWVDASGKAGTEFVMQAATFLGPDRRWEEEWIVAENGGPADDDDGWIEDMKRQFV